MGGNEIEPNLKKIIIRSVLIFIAIFILISIIYLALTYKKTTENKSELKVSTYVDPGSGETVYTVEGKAKEKTDYTNTITFLGFTSLIDHGLSYNQLNKLKSHFNQYASVKKIDISEVSITVATYKFSRNNGIKTMEFEVTINRKNKLNAKVEYVLLKDPVLYLYNQENSSEVFKSYTGGN